MRRALIAALLMSFVGHAAALPIIPFLLSAAASGVFGAVVAGIITSTVAFGLSVGIAVIGGVEARRKARSANAAARAAYNAGLQDRTVSVLRGDPPWQVVYGRAIVGGAVADIFTTDKTARRENGSTYTKADAYKHLVIVLAAHECQAINEIYIDGVALGALDGAGAPTGGEFFRSGTSTDTRSVTFTTSVVLAETPLVVLQAWSGVEGGDASNLTAQTVTISGNTLTGPTGIEVRVDYTVALSSTAGAAMVRVSKHLGADAQVTSTYLSGLNATRYTANHRLRGLCYLVVTLDLEEQRFQGGPPNITADVSGRKIYDPRTTTTVWSDNPALCVRDYLIGPWGMEVVSGDVDDTSVIAAANACDELITLVEGATSTPNQKRFTCNGAVSTDGSVEASLEDLAKSMAGRVTYGAKWRVQAGTWTASVLSLTDDDLHGQIEIVQADTSMSELMNGIRGQHIKRGAQTPSDFNPYRNATFAAADGRDLWTTGNLPFTDELPRARNLCRIFVEANRSGQVIRYPAKLKAWPLEIGDRVTVTSAEYVLTAKTYRVTDWQFDLTSAVVLTLQEDDATIYDLADAAVADPTPNTDLPNPWAVAVVAGVSATSGTATLQRQGDGTIVPRVLVSWTAITDNGVTGGGHVLISWRLNGGTTWVTMEVAGSEINAYLADVREGDPIVVDVRARNVLGAVGPSAFVTHVVVGKSAAPSNVTNLAYAIKPGQVQITWDSCPDVDYAETELRFGASWAAGALLWIGAGREYQHPRPANGTYTVWAAHLDTSGNYSATPASLSVTVTDAIDPAAGLNGTRTAVLEMYRWASSVPVTFPAGTSTYTWATGQFTAPATLNSWAITPGAGTAGQTLYVCRQIYADTLTTATTVVTWSTSTAVPDGAAGADGVNGTRTAFLEVYQWAAATPTGFPSGTSTYTWATGAFTAPGTPNGWSVTPGAAVAGQTLWGCSQRFADTGTSATSVVTWSTSTAYAVGAAGTNGATGGAGAAGDSARVAYALYTGNPVPSGSSVAVVGTPPAGLPATNSWAFATAATAWSVGTQTPASGQAMFQTVGTYVAATNTTTWTVPFLSNLRVGNLSAISADMGTITAGNINTTGYVKVEGNASTTLRDTGGTATSMTTAVAANTALGAQVGIAGLSSSASGFGVYGETTNAGGGSAGVFGYGNFGVVGRSNGAGIGVNGQAGPTSGSRGVSGTSNAVSGTVGVEAVGQTAFGGIAFRAYGTSFFDSQITSTLAIGTAPFVITSTTKVVNLNVDQLDGNDWATPASIGSTTPNVGQFTYLSSGGYDADGANVRMKTNTGSTGIGAIFRNDGSDFYLLFTASGSANGAWNTLRPLTVNLTTGAVTASKLALTDMTVGTGAAVATFSGVKPGSLATNTWVEVTINGTVYDMPIWAR